MGEQFDVSIIICTFNRCTMLAEALRSICAQEAGGSRHEVIVVDNNSTDETRATVESFIDRGHANFRYVFEGKQGLSHARNVGVAAARSPIISFTDDDVRVARDWVAAINRQFAAHPDVDAVGGKVLPLWGAAPPAWLTCEHWSPLALVDYGEMPFYVDPSRPVCLVGANMSFRRRVFDRVGLFATEFQRVKDGIGSTEDAEFQGRLWRAGHRGLYAPQIVVHADVQAERVTKAYHRRWHRGHGRFNAKGLDDEVGASTAWRLFNVPACVYKEALWDAAGWCRSLLSGRSARAFTYETRLLYFSGFVRQRLRDSRSARRQGAAGGGAGFTRSLFLAKRLPDRSEEDK